MKKLYFLSALLLCFFLCSCGSATPKSADLTEKYDFYKSSISSLKTVTGVTAEEADEIFIVLASDCGVDSLFTVTQNTSGGFYNINYGFNTLKLYLDGGTVSEVFEGDNQIFPAAPADTSSPEEISSPEETEAPADSAPEVPHRPGEEIVGVSDKDVSEISMNFAGNVRNDVTENWRYSTTSEDIDIENYALSYYQEYFESDNEIHGIINFTRKTTARLNVSGNMIFLSLYDYVDGEEHDAKIMFSGTPLASYIIYTDNGDIEKSE